MSVMNYLFIMASLATPTTSLFAQVENSDAQSISQIIYAGDMVYVQESLQARTGPGTNYPSIGKLSINDQLQIIDVIQNSNFLEVNIINSKSVEQNGQRVFVSRSYVDKQKILQTDELSSASSSKYFVIQNVATEVTRIYERCTQTPSCDHKLILEAKMVVGRNKTDENGEKGWRTNLGHYKLTQWKKFYQDQKGHYPPWYIPGIRIPKPDAGFMEWRSERYMPNKDGEMRGAFGWYTGFTGPNSDSQWIHGTIGWGRDGDKYIDAPAEYRFFINVRSAGCTRVSNPLIAYLRHILPVGTDIHRIYALEKVRDPNLSKYAGLPKMRSWNYILTSELNANDPDANAVMLRNVDPKYYIEKGTYNIDQYPTVRKYKNNLLGSEVLANGGGYGDIYIVKKKRMIGYYEIDTGKLVNYQHPHKLKASGGARPSYVVR